MATTISCRSSNRSCADGTLILHLKDNSSIRPQLPLVAEVVAGELDGVEASGAATVKIKGSAKVDRFTARASGAAQISVESVESSQAVASATGSAQLTLSGSAASLHVDASGAGRVKAQSFTAEDAHVSISGASSVTLTAKKSVAGDVSAAPIWNSMAVRRSRRSQPRGPRE